ncbi:hypothetical protein E4U21_007873 [Claviceps maximensis]|nr:hypothetical protein E4U21_007873 [Claviceps maximensis]
MSCWDLAAGMRFFWGGPARTYETTLELGNGACWMARPNAKCQMDSERRAASSDTEMDMDMDMVGRHGFALLPRARVRRPRTKHAANLRGVGGGGARRV